MRDDTAVKQMDQKLLVDAIKSQLDLAQQIVNWTLFFAAAVAWAGLQRERIIEAFGMKFDRRNAFVAIAVAYMFAMMIVCVLFLRIADLFALLDGSHFDSAITILSTHQWVLNPFSYFGPSPIARLYACEGTGLLVVMWFLCNASLYTLMDDKNNRLARRLLFVFLLHGIAAFLTFEFAFGQVIDMGARWHSSLARELQGTLRQRLGAALLGGVVGALLFAVANNAQSRSSRADSGA